MRWISLLAVLVQVPSLAADDDPYPFLEATADAVATAMAKINTGEMELEYKSRVHTVRAEHRGLHTATLTGSVLWDEESLYTSFLLAEEGTDNLGEPGEATHPSGWNGATEIIQTPALVCWYVKDKAWCRRKTVNPQHGVRFRHVQALDPRMAWFSTAQSPRDNHLKFGLTWRAENPGDDLTTVSQVKSFPRRRRILRDKRETGVPTEFVVDLDQGGMVIEGWIRPRKHDWHTTTWDWKQDPHGVWYVSHWKYTRYDGDDLDKVVLVEEATVKRFNSQPDIPANRFSFSSLKLPRGTRIEHVTEMGTSYTYVGGKSPEQAAFDLDSLIDDAQDGFAAPPRE